MPELPEVEIASRQLRAWAQGRRIVGVDVARSRVARAQPVSMFAQLVGKRLVSIERRGKWILVSFEGGLGLLSHLGMTGKWVRRKASDPAAPHSRATFLLDDGMALDYRDPRLFGQLQTATLDRLRQTRALVELGPDPLAGLDPLWLRARLAATKRSLKEALMDQTLLAGLGNIHVAESLFRAKLHPQRPAAKLTPEEAERLSRGIVQSLREALAAEDGPEPIVYVEEGGENRFLVYGHAGEPCRVCGTRIARIVQAGRSTFFCPGCQPGRAAKGKAMGQGKEKGKKGRGKGNVTRRAKARPKR